MSVLDSLGLDVNNPDALRREIRRLEAELASRPPDFMEVCRLLGADHLDVLVDHQQHWLSVARIQDQKGVRTRLARAFDYRELESARVPKTTSIVAAFAPRTQETEGSFVE